MEYLTPEVVKNKRVLMRVDFNVDLDEEGNVIDDFRIQRTLPTLKFLQDHQAEKIILISHLGQPTVPNQAFSLEPVARHLEKLLSEKIYFFHEPINSNLNQQIKELPSNSIILLENIRFYPGESQNDRDFSRELSQLGDLYINEAFSVSHREVASICAITEFLPSYPGFLLEEEIKYLDNIITNPKPPLVIILGGAKVEDKLPLIETFSSKANWILMGGVMANTILKAWNFEISDSLYEEKMIEKAKILGSQKAELMLPGDFFVLTQNQQKKSRELGQVEKGDNILDIGSVAAYTFGKIIQKAATIFWNGPMGKFEDQRFKNGTQAIIEAILENKTAKIVIGGGDTLMAFKILKPEYRIPACAGRQNTRLPAQAGLPARQTEDRFFSTGGGAMLEYLAGQILPGIKSLERV